LAQSEEIFLKMLDAGITVVAYLAIVQEEIFAMQTRPKA
jgi:hypothetical protein